MKARKFMRNCNNLILNLKMLNSLYLLVPDITANLNYKIIMRLNN
jgi:hypothetical protein